METCQIRKANADIQLVERAPEPDELFLQTRIIPLDQVRKELTLWEPSAREEVNNLENVMQAVERVSTRDIEQWTARGEKVLQIPGKAVTSRKSGTGKRKFRAVACGNFLETPSSSSGPSDSVYASGVDSSTVRLAIAHAASHSDWAGVVADVKGAFLYAPRRQTNEGEIWVIRPPYILVEMGVLRSSDRWKIKKAIYGLRSSPRDWQVHRDSVLRDMLIDWEGQTFLLVQAQSDESLWIVRKKGGGPIAGTMVIYVDDLIVFAIRALASSILESIKKVWELSTPEWIGDTGLVKFCGMEICRFGSGYRINQQSYIAELLAKYSVRDQAAVPLTRWSEPETLEQPSPEEVKSAQAVTGALLWLSTRSRPDIAYAVARMSQFATKAPQLVLEIGNQVLRYLSGTATLALEYPGTIQYPWASHGQLPRLRNDNLLELYSDASHGPNGGRSMQASVVLWRGGLILWEATRQPFVTLSSAESELVSMVHTIGQGEAMQAVVEELLETSVHLVLLGDNAASVRSFEIADSSWRNRHLRLRAASGREKVNAGVLTVAYLPGEYQVADIATKPLSRQRILQLLELCNVKMPTDAPLAVGVRALRRIAWDCLDKITISPATLMVICMLYCVTPAHACFPKRLAVAMITVPRALAQAHWVAMGLDMTNVLLGTLLALILALMVWVLGILRGNRLGSRAGFFPSGTRQGLEVLEPPDPLREREETTGLMLVQRARLRRQLQEGGVVDPPIMFQRYGSLPAWLSDPDDGEEVPENQDGGSNVHESHRQVGGSTSVAPQVQIGGSSGSADPAPVSGLVGPNALPIPAADNCGIVGVNERQPTPSTHVITGDFNSGTLSPFSRFVYAVGGRRVAWRYRDECVSILRNLLTLAGEVLIGFLGDGSRELRSLAAVGATFPTGVMSGLGRFRVLGSFQSVGTDVTQAYVQTPDQRNMREEDFSDDPALDDIPHLLPVIEGRPLHVVPIPYMYRTEGEGSEEESFGSDFSSSSSPSPSSQPSEPEQEPPLILTMSASHSPDACGSRASIPICYGQIQYRAEEECLLVFHVDDVLRIPLPGWPREDIQAIVQGLSGDWTTFSAIIERDSPFPLDTPEPYVEPPVDISGGTMLALEDDNTVTTSAGSSNMITVHQLIQGVGGFSAGLTLGCVVLGLVLWLELDSVGPTGWVLIAWLSSVWYRSARLLLTLLWGGLAALPSASGFDVGSSIALLAWTQRWRAQVGQGGSISASFVVWLFLILLFGLMNPSDATSIYRSARLLLTLLWGGLAALPSASGFDVGSSIALLAWTQRWRAQVGQGGSISASFVVWLFLILLFGLMNPSDATSKTDTLPVKSSLDDQYGLVIRSQTVCEVPHLPIPV